MKKVDNSMVRNLHDDPYFNPPEYEECPNCEGKGYYLRKLAEPSGLPRECAKCKGEGRIIKKAIDIHEEGEY